MICPGCGRDHFECEDPVMAAPDDVQWWGDCPACGYESFPSLYGVRITPEEADARSVLPRWRPRAGVYR